MSENLIVEILKKETIIDNYSAFHRISEDVSEWGFDEFVYDLPNKWDLSLCIWDDAPIAYAMLSRKWTDRIHIHQFMVKKEYRRSGVGGVLMSDLIKRYSKDPISLKVESNNNGAIRFYNRYGFIFKGVEDGNGWMWKQK